MKTQRSILQTCSSFLRVAASLRSTALCLACTLAVTAVAEDELEKMLPRLKPTPPEESLKTFRIEEGFKMELVAAEPNVTDPVDAAFDEEGKLYVCELWNYPDAPKEGGVLGRIRLLQATRNDGHYDKSTIFADKIPNPAGIACWKGGVFVLASPDMLYLRDTQGTGTAGERQTVYTGFRGKTYEVPNSLRWGLDNRLYGASNYAGGSIKSVGKPELPAVEIGHNRDFRFDPADGQFEAVSGSEEFGNCFDDWGNRFNCDATHIIVHPVLPREYLERNPYFPFPNIVEFPFAQWAPVYSISAPEPWRVVRQKFWSRWVNQSPDMNAGRFPPNELAPRGFATAACGVTVYRGSAYPDAFKGDVFVAEPANNVVMRMKLNAGSVGFVATRPQEESKREFIACTDPWFRPVNFINGPDGCLYVIAMYREVIEDHSAIPNDILKYLDLNSGRDMGRIYRIVPENFVRPGRPHLRDATPQDLVVALGHPDSWWRETAQRLIYEKQDKSAAELITRMLTSNPSAQFRVHALWTLEGMGDLSDEILLNALADRDPHVREQALKLSESRFDKSPALLKAALALAGDAYGRLRFQTALSLSAAQSDDATAALAQIARRDVADKWIRAAVLTAVAGRSLKVFKALLSDADFFNQHEAVSFLGQLAQIVATRNQAGETEALLALVANNDPATPQSLKDARRNILAQIGDGLSRAGSSLSEVLNKPEFPEPVKTEIGRVFAEAGQVALDPRKQSGERTDAIRFLGFAPFKNVSGTFEQLLEASQTHSIQLAAIRALSVQNDPQVGVMLIEHWRNYGPLLRPDILEALFRRPERLNALLEAIASNKISVNELDPQRRKSLLNHAEAKIRERATELLGQQKPSDKQALIDKYRASLNKLTGDPSRGGEVFQKNCAICHGHDAQGHAVGPDLATLQDRSPDTLLIAILDPNRDVKPNFINYTLIATDGQAFSGIIVAETASSVTLKRAGGGEDSILRTNIKKLTSTGVSLMPEALEGAINEQQMADLLRFLQDYK